MIEKTFGDRKVLIFRDIHAIAAYLIDRWAECAAREIERKGEFTVALSGGSTPVSIYRALASQKRLPWNKTHVFMVDERFVPYESDDNNFRMINESLLMHVTIPARNIHPIITSYPTSGESAALYEDHIISFFKLSPGTFPSLDLVLLGIGEDGHTASLFPGTAALHDTSHRAVAVIPPDESIRERITLTFPMIHHASQVCILAAGKGKASVLRDVIVTGTSGLPAAMVQPSRGQTLFLLDREAGSLLAAEDK